MTLSKTATHIAVGLIFLLIAAAVGGAIWFLVVASPSFNAQDEQAQLKRMQVSAQLYRYRMTTYEGVCKDVGALGQFTCNETADAYAIEVWLESGKYFCVDSTEFAGEVYTSIGAATACPRR